MATPLNKARIVDGAFALLDEVGIDGLTVRALASRLGVKAPALYWHFDSKQALLDAMGTEVTRRIGATLDELPDDVDLSDALRAYAVAMRSEYLQHRDGARTFSGTRLTDPSVLRRQERSLASWTGQGFALQQIVDCFGIITSFVVGFVIEEQERAQSATERYDLDRRDAALGGDHPLAVAAGHLIFSSADERFGRHLDVIIPALTAREGLAEKQNVVSASRFTGGPSRRPLR